MSLNHNDNPLPYGDQPAPSPNESATYPKMLDHALEYANRGWHVFPLRSPVNGGCSCTKGDCQSPAKHPRTPNGLNDATIDQRAITEYWTRWSDANIGIRTGRISGIVVLDIDANHGGLESWRDLQDLNCRVDALTCHTGGGGLHLYFQAPDDEPKSSTSEIGPGVDTRAEGGYVVAPPSLHISGKRYQWEGEEL